MKKSQRFVFGLGTLFMLGGVLSAGFIYREMREERLLREPIRIFTMDPSRASGWHGAPLPLYQNGNHALFLSLSSPRHKRRTGTSSNDSSMNYDGFVEVVIADPRGTAVLQTTGPDVRKGIPKANHIYWFPLDTLHVDSIRSSEWKVQMRIVSGDSLFNGSLAELVFLPPDSEHFGAYIEQNSYKLFASGFLAFSGFLLVMVGRRRTRKH